MDASVHALPTLCFERARRQARQLESLAVDQRGPLYGLPITIKDLTPVAGVRTTFGSALYRDYIADTSDRLVSLLEDRGAVIYAKSNTPEFGTGGITFNDLFPPTRSPRNCRYASGGSSGGAAASLAAGSAWLSLGSDMAGSLRTPAAFCGVTSFRPSPGLVHTDSEYLPYEVLSATGPMARSIADLGLFADAMMQNPPGSMLASAQSPQMPARVAISPDLGITTVAEPMVELINEVEEELIQAGIEVQRAHPDLDGVHEAFDVLRAHDYAIGLEQSLLDHPGIMKPEVEWNIRSGLELSAEQIRRATRLQGKIINAAAGFMDDYDLLVCPATSLPRVKAELRYPGSDSGVPIAEYYRWLAIAYATTMTTLPVITLPWKFLDQGMPGAIQLVGKAGGELELFRFASALEKLCGWSPEPVDPTSGPRS